jgi:hypothetical protein
VSAPSTNHAQTPHTAVRTEPSRTHTNTNAARQPNRSEVRSPSTHNAAPRQNVRQEHSAPAHAPAQHQAPQSHATQHASGGGGERSGGGHGGGSHNEPKQK